MSERTSYAEGTPSWVDLGAADVEGAHEFYAGLFGWEFQIGAPEMGHYGMCTLGGLPVAGIGPQKDPAIPPAWMTYLASDDVGKTAARILEAGGQVLMEPMQVMEFGSMLIGVDPGGAVFGVWQAGSVAGSARVNEPGAPYWNEVVTRDPEAVDTFYRSVFGYELVPLGDEGQPLPDGPTEVEYVTFKVGDNVVGGRMRMDERWPAELPSHWMTYFAVTDVDAAAARVGELGGTVRVEPFDTPYGRIAVVADRDGATFSVMATTEPPSF